MKLLVEKVLVWKLVDGNKAFWPVKLLQGNCVHCFLYIELWLSENKREKSDPRCVILTISDTFLQHVIHADTGVKQTFRKTLVYSQCLFTVHVCPVYVYFEAISETFSS